MNDETPREPDVVTDQAAEELDIRRPDVPITVEELSALGLEASKKIIAAREQIIETLRAASIRQTHPSDWVLNKDRDGRVVAYLEDKGCQRLMDLWGIEVQRVTEPQKTNAEDGKSFAYTVVGDGYCKVTRRTVDNVEGTRYSTEMYAQEKPEGIQRDVAVRKAARANLEGRIVRNLAGLNGVPLEELVQVSGDKDFERKATRGHGYGTAGERRGVESDHGLAPADFPKCDACLDLKPPKTTTMVYKKEMGPKKEPGWFCPNWKAHESMKSYVNHAQYVEQLAKEKASKAETREAGDEA